MDLPSEPYYRPDLALVHHRGFAFHAAACAPGILRLLAPVRRDGGLVLEVGCGTGLLTRELLSAGHRVLATDASPSMLELAAAHLREQPDGHPQTGRAELRLLTLPDDPLPEADAIVGVGHAVNYLPDADAVDRAFVAMAHALRPGGLLAVDVCDLSWGEAHRQQPNLGRVAPDWAIITEFSLPSPDRYVRDITTFVANGDGTWRRDHERHVNVLIDTSRVPALLGAHDLHARIGSTFGGEPLPAGLHVVLGEKR